ncbi:MAG: TRAP transporter substrate-binding protein [Desulfamplus sp.]|nr:TRAP transporter substrate-binding protein [Desulfamplus sp.]
MQNRIVILLSLAALASGIFLFINSKNSSTVDNKPVAQQVYSLRFGHNIQEDSALHTAAVKFADVVREKSKGKLDVKVYPSQQLGNDDVMLEMARNGEIDIVLTPTAKISPLVPSMQFPDLPFLFSSREDAYRVLDGETGRFLLAKLSEYGLVGAAIWKNGFKQFTANKPIRRPDDFSGLNIRVMKSQIISDQFRAFGANPIPIDFHKTYDALKDKVVDGQENPLVAIVNMKFYEVQKYLIISNHAYLGYVLSFSQKVFSSLPPELQSILIDTAKELTPFEHAETEKREADFIETIKKSGTEIITLTPDEIKLFQRATSHLMPKYRDIIGSDIIDAATATLSRHE